MNVHDNIPEYTGGQNQKTSTRRFQLRLDVEHAWPGLIFKQVGNFSESKVNPSDPTEANG